MGPRQIDEAHRSATPLELLFDLTFVVAIAQLAGRLAHATLDGHLSAIGPFLMVFFAIWWAWMNFTWFASAYDTDDVSYRLATFVQMGAVLVLAAGTGRAFDHGDYAVVTVGYLIMRVGLLSMWLRAAVQHPSGRPTSLRYAGGIASLQILWLVRLGLTDRVSVATFVVLAAMELLVPVWAERAGGPTSWHPHHIAERYSLFTIILLGEGVLAVTTGVVSVVEDAAGLSLAIISASSLAIIASLWWLYFAVPAGEPLAVRRHRSFLWGYGHYVPFAALAALGAGLEITVAASTGHAAGLPVWVATLTVALPVALTIGSVELLRPSGRERPFRNRAATVAALMILLIAVPASQVIGLIAGICLVALVAAGAVVSDRMDLRRPGREPERRAAHVSLEERS